MGDFEGVEDGAVLALGVGFAGFVAGSDGGGEPRHWVAWPIGLGLAQDRESGGAVVAEVAEHAAEEGAAWTLGFAGYLAENRQSFGPELGADV